MEQINHYREFLRGGFRLSAGAAAAGMMLAVCFFFRFRMMSVFRIMRGQAEMRAMRRREEKRRKMRTAESPEEMPKEDFRIIESIIVIHTDEVIL